jgi:hypothetical protein
LKSRPAGGERDPKTENLPDWGRSAKARQEWGRGGF